MIESEVTGEVTVIKPTTVPMARRIPTTPVISFGGPLVVLLDTLVIVTHFAITITVLALCLAIMIFVLCLTIAAG